MLDENLQDYSNININNKKNLKSIQEKFKYIASSCGAFDEVLLQMGISEIKSNIKIKSDTILKLNSITLKNQIQKKQIGGLHSAVLFNSEGEIIFLAEDIARHNCFDKISGFIYIKKIDTKDKIIFTTGRVSIDVVLKAIVSKVPLIVSNSSVTYSAALLARKANITLIGYSRGQRFNIYSCPRRIL